MKNLSVMIKPASSLCNMRCKYCFYADISSIREQPSYGVMTSETRKKVLSNIFSQPTMFPQHKSMIGIHQKKRILP